MLSKPLKVSLKKLNNEAVLPKYSKSGDAGMDITATSVEESETQVTYGTGLSIELPDGYVGLLFQRSSICKKDLVLSNAVGVLDSGYRGEIKFIFNKKYVNTSYLNNGQERYLKTNDIYKVGERIGQILILPYPQIQFVEQEELSESERGENGFGSTGI